MGSDDEYVRDCDAGHQRGRAGEWSDPDRGCAVAKVTLEIDMDRLVDAGFNLAGQLHEWRIKEALFDALWQQHPEPMEHYYREVVKLIHAVQDIKNAARANAPAKQWWADEEIEADWLSTTRDAASRNY